MKLIMEMNYDTLLRMMKSRKEFASAITRFSATAPGVGFEGMVGYCSVGCEFNIKDLEIFTELWTKSIQ
jgi:hypothetical protein